MNEEYISIAEFAKKAGVSVQAIYKRLSTDLSTEFKLVENRKMLKVSALERFGLNQVDNQFNNQVESTEALLRMVSMLEKELEVKNEQIREQSRQINELHDRLKESHVLLDQQQHLHAANLLEEKTTAEIDELTTGAIDPEQSELTKKKKKPWQFWR